MYEMICRMGNNENGITSARTAFRGTLLQYELLPAGLENKRQRILTLSAAHMHGLGTLDNPSRRRGQSEWDACLPVLAPVQSDWDQPHGLWGWAQNLPSKPGHISPCLRSRRRAREKRVRHPIMIHSGKKIQSGNTIISSPPQSLLFD